jgi:hypothetical protein
MMFGMLCQTFFSLFLEKLFSHIQASSSQPDHTVLEASVGPASISFEVCGTNYHITLYSVDLQHICFALMHKLLEIKNDYSFRGSPTLISSHIYQFVFSCRSQHMGCSVRMNDQCTPLKKTNIP